MRREEDNLPDPDNTHLTVLGCTVIKKASSGPIQTGNAPLYFSAYSAVLNIPS